MQPQRIFALTLLLAILTACGPGATQQPTATRPQPTVTPTPTPVARTEVLMGFTAEGWPYRGNPDAPVTLYEFSEFQCPYCARHTLQTGPLIYEAYVATGKVKEVFLQFPLDSIHPQARKAGEASLCAAKQSAEAYWAMHERLFASTSEWSGKENALDVFKGYATELGLDVQAFAACLDSGETNPQMLAQYQEGLNRGVSSVPAFFVNEWSIVGAQSFASFQKVIEKALRGERPPPTPTPLPAGKTFTDANPDRPGYTYGGDAFRGSPDAEVLLFEFVDFGSSDNRKHALEIWPALEKKYVDTGRVMFLVKHFPAQQPANLLAAEAAECAGQQSAFWGMYELLFQRQEEWTKAGDVAAALKGYATKLNLDAAAFAACLDGGQAKAKVEGDLDIGVENGFPPAPVFFIFKGQQGGHVPTGQLQQALEQFAVP